jgi:pimeloyl-ACP methyl ester carboxylesterase
MDGIADLLHAVIEKVQNGGPLIVVAHDFGVIYSTWLLSKYPKDAFAIVQFDVGGDLGINVNGGDQISIQTLEKLWDYGNKYQYALILLWLLDRVPATSNLLKLYLDSNPDLLKIFSGPGVPNVIRPASGYSYFYLHLYPLTQYLLNLTGDNALNLYPSWAKGEELKVPILYLYGTEKPYMFHVDTWLSSLNKRRDGSNVVALSTGHYVFVDDPKEVAKHMDPFLETMFARAL